MSIDVALGACICAAFVSDYIEVALPLSIIVTLGLGVWIIYTGDHLLDAYKVKHIAATHRHRFHQEHFNKILAFWMTGVLVGVIMLFQLPIDTVKWGLILFGGVLLYYGFLQIPNTKLCYFKEVAIATIYVLGIFLGPLSLNNGIIGADVLLIFGVYLLLALVNLLLFSVYENQKDIKDGHISMVQALGINTTLRVISGLVVIAIGLLTVLTLVVSNVITIVLLLSVMLLLLMSMMLFKSYYRQGERYRIVGDAVFLLPAFGIIL